MRKSLLSIILLVFVAMRVEAQDATITGKIISKEKGEPLIGANIIIDDTVGTATDLDGKFTITVGPGVHKVLCRFLGCNPHTQTIEIKAGELHQLNIALREEATQLGTVVVSAGKFEQKIEEVTVSMAVINPGLVESKGTTNMETAVNQAPGVQIIDSEPQIRCGSGYSFGAGSRVMIMVDDLPVLSGDAGRPSWNFLPVENLEQIEIIKGASSVLYGSAALSGVINIRTAYPKDKPESKINIQTGIYDNPSRRHAIYWGDANPTYSGLNFFHSRKINNLDLVFGGNFFADQGYIGPAPDDITVKFGGKDTIALNGQQLTGAGNDTVFQYVSQGVGKFENRARMNANLRYRSKKIEGLDFGVNFNAMYSRFPSVLLMLDTDTGMYRAFPGAITTTLKTIANVDPFINYYGKGGIKHSLRTRMYYEDNNNDNNQANKSVLYYGEYQFQKQFEKIRNLTATTGLMGTYSESNSELYKGNESGTPINFSRNLAFYAQLDKKFYDRITVSAGGRYETFEINETDKESKPVFRAGASARVLKETYIRASFGEGFRFPTIAEKYVRTQVGPMNIYPNENIQSEKSWNAEIGLKQGVKAGEFYGYLDAAVFQQEIKNSLEFNFGKFGVVTDPLNGLGFKSINVGKARIRGVDISLVGQGKLGPFTLNILAGYTYTQPVTLTPDDTIPTETPIYATYKLSSSDTSGEFQILKYRFQHLAKADIELTYSKFSLGWSFRYNSFMRNIDKIFLDLDKDSEIVPLKGMLPTGIKDYRDKKNGLGDYVMDLRASYQLSETVKTAIIVNNLLNREYMIRPLNIESPRTFAVQFIIHF